MVSITPTSTATVWSTGPAYWGQYTSHLTPHTSHLTPHTPALLSLQGRHSSHLLRPDRPRRLLLRARQRLACRHPAHPQQGPVRQEGAGLGQGGGGGVLRVAVACRDLLTPHLQPVDLIVVGRNPRKTSRFVRLWLNSDR